MSVEQADRKKQNNGDAISWCYQFKPPHTKAEQGDRHQSEDQLERVGLRLRKKNANDFAGTQNDSQQANEAQPLDFKKIKGCKDKGEARNGRQSPNLQGFHADSVRQIVVHVLQTKQKLGAGLEA